MIDRSKPLPIHEGRNLIDDVARLKKRNEIKPHVSILVAYSELAPILDVLGEIRAGDEDRLNNVISLAGLCGSMSEPPEFDEADIDCLRRYRDMAKKMEENR